MKYRIRHKNRYHYEQPVSLCHSQAWLLPRDTLNQMVLSSRLVILPVVEQVSERTDLFGNRVSQFAIEELHNELTVLAESEVEVRPVRTEMPRTQAWDDALAIPAKTRLFLRPSHYVSVGDALVYGASGDFFRPGRDLMETLDEVNQFIFHEFIYDPHFSQVDTPLSAILEAKRGVCQDFAHLMLAILRSHQIPCRYVSGYLETDPPPGQPKLMGADASHAWVSVFVPGTGWVDFDPTNGLKPSERHVTLAWGRDYADVVPLKGLMTGGSQHALDVSVDVLPIQ